MASKTVAKNRQSPRIDAGKARKSSRRRAARRLREDYGNALIAAAARPCARPIPNNRSAKAYNHESDRIVRREKLVDLSRQPHFPDPKTRKDAVAMIENLHRPLDARRLKGILAWRAEDPPVIDAKTALDADRAEIRSKSLPWITKMRTRKSHFRNRSINC
jgi:hypothetical protein